MVVTNEQQKDMYRKITSKVGKIKHKFNQSLVNSDYFSSRDSQKLLDRNRLTTKIRSTSKDMLVSASTQFNARLENFLLQVSTDKQQRFSKQTELAKSS